jgi:hypothetical protein
MKYFLYLFKNKLAGDKYFKTEVVYHILFPKPCDHEVMSSTSGNTKMQRKTAYIRPKVVGAFCELPFNVFTW